MGYYGYKSIHLSFNTESKRYHRHDPNQQKPSKIFPLSSSSSTSMAISLCCILPSPFSPQHPYNFHSTQFPHNPLSLRQHSRRITPKALREWREYEQAAKDKDLGKALRFLQDIPQVNDLQSELVELQRDSEVLATCLNADDMRLVASAYVFLKDKGFLNQYEKYRSIGNVLYRDVFC
ncbi:hypothetical protein HanIR_Chr01g0031581 [Helianthus annuus]|nr:hypothetical protein HanIR_Chr01g0031581 [Helianthus annuus]